MSPLELTRENAKLRERLHALNEELVVSRNVADGWAREIQTLHTEAYFRERELQELRARIAAEAGTA